MVRQRVSQEMPRIRVLHTCNLLAKKTTGNYRCSWQCRPRQAPNTNVCDNAAQSQTSDVLDIAGHNDLLRPMFVAGMASGNILAPFWEHLTPLSEHLWYPSKAGVLYDTFFKNIHLTISRSS